MIGEFNRLPQGDSHRASTQKNKFRNDGKNMNYVLNYNKRII